MYLSRQIQPLVNRLLKQFPAVLVTGARQVGKSTLLKHIAKDYAYLTFDDPLLLEQAKQEPRLFFLNHAGNVILDEVQYAQELFSLLKLEIDKQQKNGTFLLSGSQAFELMQNVSETLAGRIAILKLQGLSLREILNVEFYLPFIPSRDYLASREKMLKSPENIWQIIHKGDMPRLYQQETDWEIYYSSYVSTYIERDVRQLTNITNTTDFTRFMVALASRSGELLNYSNVAQEVGVSNETIKRWTAILQTSGIIYLLQPYSNNHLKRTIKTPKIYFLNTGLMAYLTKWLTPETISKGAKSGQFFESFVVSEIIKSFTNNGIEPPLYFYRNTNQKEIDLIIEYDRTIYPIEIKTTANPNKKMAKSFALLNSLGKESTIGMGVIINQYPNKHYLAENLVALPVKYL
ncbi:ATP-binding protein [Aggregatibacter actinomycetemcomitans]|uniref:Possible AAA+ superfamily ATPase n=2 Tax=Aggregatibacter actinomycetemcomitans TaxID=714 RepID=G4A8N8_AGGAC|nr:ATP-binding protein [Aggregatibacter actinomycetemcomitans]EGY33787.1 possible AAA+ superfamily ATPase [Aggregatibacter actinomycetemcomitans serotype e str. SC1083]EHK90361.1 putative AAA+ superfamily ATPase [Aggregatibacter actinomycetemcomitans RhAA1]KNE77425.1 ATPase [Aggregatibacter actinomycetemcomitans RhAA1]KYK73689.1 ATPase [Aggregatibacter actinomycetemcomitans serotype e str. SA3096]KYK80044.1 ATPase [Aggregatibacter actinomycetemcomitans serotype e str. SC936]